MGPEELSGLTPTAKVKLSFTGRAGPGGFWFHAVIFAGMVHGPPHHVKVRHNWIMILQDRVGAFAVEFLTACFPEQDSLPSGGGMVRNGIRLSCHSQESCSSP
jgi:hypothetical protein